MSTASFISGGAATIGNCINNIDGTCGWGVASTAASVIPSAGAGGKYAKRIYDEIQKYKPTFSNSIKDSVIRQTTVNKKFIYSSMQSAGFGIDRLGSSIMKGKNNC